MTEANILLTEELAEEAQRAGNYTMLSPERVLALCTALREAWARIVALEYRLAEIDRHTLVALRSCSTCGKPYVVESGMCGFCGAQQ